jgi:uncharacterized protein (DUF849 family)
MSDKVIVTAAITGGIHVPTMSDHLPFDPDHIIEEIVRVYNAGGAVAHVHVRDPKTGQPVTDLKLFRYILTEVKKRCPIIVCTTTGAALGMTAEDRLKVIPEFKPELASFNAGSMNFALFPLLDKYKEFKFDWEPKYLESTRELIFPNTFGTMEKFCETFKANGTKPELEVYDLGMINNVVTMIKRGWMPQPVYIQFVLGILGGAVAKPQHLMYLVKEATAELKGNFVWSVASAGKDQFKMATQSLIMGGNVRVGLEDNLYIAKGQLAKSNAEQVEKVIRIARELGREPATPDEARQILGLKGIDQVNY